MIPELLSTYGLPILQSILAARIDSSLNDWVKSDDSLEGGRFNQIMKTAFIKAVKRIKGDSPKIVKDNVDELFDECRGLVLEEIRSREPAQVMAYIEEDLYNAFKEELENCSEAIPYINRTLLEEILSKTDKYVSLIHSIHENTLAIKKATSEILAISKNLMSGSGLTACKIVAWAGENRILLPSLCAGRSQLIDELAVRLNSEKCLVLYAGVKEGKTVASRLLAKRMESEFFIVEIDFANRNERNLEYILDAYKSNERCLFILDGIKYESDIYEVFCDIIRRYASDNWLFIINSYDRINDHVFDEDLQLPDKQLPPLTFEEVEEMIPVEKRDTWCKLIWSLFGGQPLLTNAICTYLHKNSWALSPSNLTNLFTFPKGETIERQIKILLQRTVGDEKAYNLLNRLMTLNRPFTEEQCAEIAGVNPIISNPCRLLGELTGTWVTEKDGKFLVSNLLRKTVNPDLCPQEKKDCYLYEVDRLLKMKDITPWDALTILNCLVSAREFDQAGGFYTIMLAKLKEQGLWETKGASIIKALWVGLPLPNEMGVQVKLSVRSCQLILINDLPKQYVENIIDEIFILLNHEGIDKKLRSNVTYALMAYCLLNGYHERAIMLQQQISANDIKTYNMKEVALVSLNNVKDSKELNNWYKLYISLGLPQDDVDPEEAIITVNRLYDSVADNERESLLTDIIKNAETYNAEIFTIVAAAKLVDNYWQSNNADKAKVVFESMKGKLSNGMGEILLNYSHGLGLYNHGAKDEAVPYLESAAKGKNIETACMVALNARCTYAQILGDRGDKHGAAMIISEVVNHSRFSYIYSQWEQDAALCSLAYAWWEDGSRKEAVRLLLKVEQHLWTQRNAKDDGFINLSMRFAVLAMYMQESNMGKQVDGKFMTPDYGLFVKDIPALKNEYKPERNFTVELAVYSLAESFADSDTALTIVEHMLDFQRDDAAGYAHFLSIMVQAFSLCLEKGRKDIVEYIMLAVLCAPNKDKEEKVVNYETLVLLGGLSIIVAYRAKCQIEGTDFDDEWLFALIEKSVNVLASPDDSRFMLEQMKSDTPQYADVKDVLRQEIVYAFHYSKVDFCHQLILLWQFSRSLDKFGAMSSAQRCLKEFELSYAKFLVRENPTKFKLSPSSVETYFSKVAKYERLDYVKKVIQGLYFHTKADVELTDEMKEFVNE